MLQSAIQKYSSILNYQINLYKRFFIFRISLGSTAANSVVTPNVVPPARRASVPCTTTVQPRAQHLPSITQMHKTRMHLHLPSTLPTLGHNKQVISRIRKPAAPACLKEHSPTGDGKVTKKVSLLLYKHYHLHILLYKHCLLHINNIIYTPPCS